jgi:hypothetical protein
MAINDATINKWANMLPGSTSHKDKSPASTREASSARRIHGFPRRPILRTGSRRLGRLSRLMEAPRRTRPATTSSANFSRTQRYDSPGLRGRSGGPCICSLTSI